MTGAPLEMFRRGDLVRVRLDGVVQRGLYVFDGIERADGLVMVRRQGYASPRMYAPDRVELIDHDARWSS